MRYDTHTHLLDLPATNLKNRTNIQTQKISI